MKNFVYIFILPLMFVVFILSSKSVDAALTISSDDSATTTVSVASPISSIEIVGSSASTTPVKLRVTSGTLSLGTTSGLTFSGSTSGSTLQFSGTVADINTALTTLTYTRGSVGSDTLEISLVEDGEVFFPDNNHLYIVVDDNVTANSARTLAQGYTEYGQQGYLASITTPSENAYVSARLSGGGWIGGSDAAVEGEWRWLDGPEAGDQFWLGGSDGSAIGGNYTNWNPGEPNNSGNEDCLQYVSGGSGRWNDLPCGSFLLPFVVEFGDDSGEPLTASMNISITTIDAPAIDTLSPVDNATDVPIDSNLELTFNMIVGWYSGDILIKKVSDGSIFETIPVGGGPVSGSGTDTLVINPFNDFEYDTEYYVEIPGTAVRDITNDLYFQGLTGTTTWSFITEEDIVAPVLTESIDIPDSVLSTDDAIYYFQTNESCNVQVPTLNSSIGTVYALSESAETINSNIGITLQGMQAGGTYSFSIRCVDDAGNESNILNVGPFTVTSNSSGKKAGTSVKARVQNLVKSGNTERAEELKQEFSHLFENASQENSQSGNSTVRDLEITLTGPDVKALQQLLNAQGYLLAETGVGSTGNETEYFGILTQNALIKYQQANNISPAIGYFGSITRAQMKTAGLSGLWW